MHLQRWPLQRSSLPLHPSLYTILHHMCPSDWHHIFFCLPHATLDRLARVWVPTGVVLFPPLHALLPYLPHLLTLATHLTIINCFLPRNLHPTHDTVVDQVGFLNPRVISYRPLTSATLKKLWAWEILYMYLIPQIWAYSVQKRPRYAPDLRNTRLVGFLVMSGFLVELRKAKKNI